MRKFKYKNQTSAGTSDRSDLQSGKKSYYAQNTTVKKAQVQPAPPAPTPQTPAETEETGYISVGVFTALGALPVANAVVTVYRHDDQGKENVISHLVTDISGQVPKINLPVAYSPENPLESAKYYFTTYNLRVQAAQYYPVNVLDVRVFPGITTNYKIDMIPVMAGDTGVRPDQTYVIPPSPIDKSNE